MPANYAGILCVKMFYSYCAGAVSTGTVCAGVAVAGTGVAGVVLAGVLFPESSINFDSELAEPLSKLKLDIIISTINIVASVHVLLSRKSVVF